MFGVNRHLPARLLLMAWLTFWIFASTGFAQEPVKTSSVLAPLTLNLTADSSVVSACPEDPGTSSSRVKLHANATSPGGHALQYRWSASAGRIDAEGTTVMWDLSGLQQGYYQAFVHAYTSNLGEECEVLSSTTVLVNRCAPVCPTTTIICPDNFTGDGPLTFFTTVTGGSAGVVPLYNWTISAGRIIEGQGTSAIKVDRTGLTGQMVRATISIGGYDRDCLASCAVSIPVPIRTARKFDEFPELTRNDEKARLDNFVVDLTTDPTATAYVIVYSSRRGRNGDAQRLARRIVDYLIYSRGLDARRIVTLVGPPRNNLLVELWIAPQGAQPPAPLP